MSDETKERLWGVYSQQACDRGTGLVAYLGEDGNEHTLTCLGKSKKEVEETYRWPDIVHHGWMVRWIRTVRPNRDFIVER
jgi:hypothetical protein